MADATDDSARERDTRERILEAAQRRFAARGRDGVTMREIAGDTGVTLPTLYHHFGDKHGLHGACVARAVGDVARTLRDAVAGARTRQARAEAFASALCGSLLGNDVLSGLLLREALDGARPATDLVPAELLDEVDEALATGSPPAGLMTPARRLLAYAWGMAIVCRSDGSFVRVPPAEALARLLLAASCQAG